jgi:3-methylcrotonyl-CoA carboxylase alpha subunit
VVQVLVAPGTEVAKGEPLIVLSAMKVEHTLVAPGPGQVARVLARSGDQVEEGALLIAFAEAEQSTG